MNHIEAMKQALEALDSLLYWDNGKPEYDEAREAITALRTAIEQAEKQEPVAVVSVNTLAKMFQYTAADPTQWQHHWAKGWNDAIRQAMGYTTPPAAQEEIQRLSALVRAQQITIDKLEAQLREKNAGETK